MKYIVPATDKNYYVLRKSHSYFAMKTVLFSALFSVSFCDEKQSSFRLYFMSEKLIKTGFKKPLKNLSKETSKKSVEKNL